jgi:hypothetical protein
MSECSGPCPDLRQGPFDSPGIHIADDKARRIAAASGGSQEGPVRGKEGGRDRSVAARNSSSMF